jgi:uncharacterized membrane protein
MEMIMGRLLQAGVLLAAAVVTTGGVMYVLGHPGARGDYSVFVAKPVEVRHLAMLLGSVRQGNAEAIIDLGILLLIATPIFRVLFAVVAFSAERDRLYIAVSITVLAVLLFGMLRGS